MKKTEALEKRIKVLESAVEELACHLVANVVMLVALPEWKGLDVAEVDANIDRVDVPPGREDLRKRIRANAHRLLNQRKPLSGGTHAGTHGQPREKGKRRKVVHP